MGIKVFITNISSSTDIKKKQRELLQTLESLKIEFETVDISDPSKEEEKKFMRANSKPAQEGKVPLPPQVFKDDDYCGDFDAFSEALEDNALYEFLKLAPPKEVSQASVTVTGVSYWYIILDYYRIENHNGKYAQETTIKNSGSFWVLKERHQSCDGMRDV